MALQALIAFLTDPTLASQIDQLTAGTPPRTTVGSGCEMEWGMRG